MDLTGLIEASVRSVSVRCFQTVLTEEESPDLGSYLATGLSPRLNKSRLEQAISASDLQSYEEAPRSKLLLLFHHAFLS